MTFGVVDLPVALIVPLGVVDLLVAPDRERTVGVVDLLLLFVILGAKVHSWSLSSFSRNSLIWISIRRLFFNISGVAATTSASAAGIATGFTDDWEKFKFVHPYLITRDIGIL